MTDLTKSLIATAAFLQAHHHDAADVLEAIAVLERLTAERDGAYERAARVADEHYDEIGRAAAHHLREGNEDSLGRCHARQRSASQIAAAIRQLGRD